MVSLGSLLLDGAEVPKNTKIGLALLSKAADMDEEDISSSNRGFEELGNVLHKGRWHTAKLYDQSSILSTRCSAMRWRFDGVGGLVL
jgi:hypothetical protein